METKTLTDTLGIFGSELASILVKESTIVQIDADKEILKENQWVSHIPLVIDGLVKVYAKFDEKELLLYYIQPLESCIMSFSAVRQNHRSRVFAITERPSTILLLPSEKLHFWLLSHPGLHDLFYREYDKRYEDLLISLEGILSGSIETRLMDYIHQKTNLLKTNSFEYSPSKIAKELGTAREVVSRVLRKLQQDRKIILENNFILLPVS